MGDRGGSRVRGTQRRRRRSDAGAVAVEFALILPLLAMLLFGVTTAGLTYSDHLSVTNAVREASRLGAAIDFNTSPTTPTIWANAVQQNVRQVYFNAASSVPLDNICVALVDSSDVHLATPSAQGTKCGTEPALPAGVTAGTCVVKVWVSKSATISILVATLHPTIGAEAEDYYGRTVGACTAS